MISGQAMRRVTHSCMVKLPTAGDQSRSLKSRTEPAAGPSGSVAVGCRRLPQQGEVRPATLRGFTPREPWQFVKVRIEAQKLRLLVVLEQRRMVGIDIVNGVGDIEIEDSGVEPLSLQLQMGQGDEREESIS